MNRIVTIMLKKCDELSYGYCPENWYTQGYYCKDGHILLDSTTTDCNGDYTYTANAVKGFAVYAGPWIENTLFDPTVSLLGEINPNTGQMSYIPFAGKEELFYKRTPFLPDESDIFYSGLYALYFTGGRYYSYSFAYGGITDLTDAAGSFEIFGFGGKAPPCLGNTPWTPLASTGFPAGYASAVGGSSFGAGPASNYLNGNWTVNLTGRSALIRALVKKNNRLYSIGGVQFTLTDSCGNSETTAATSSAGYATLSQVDWGKINSASVAAGMPSCADTYPDATHVDQGPLTTPLRFSPYEIFPDLVDLSQLPLVGSPSPVVLYAYLLDCDGTVAPSEAVRADTSSGQIAVAWTDGGKLYTSVHRGAQKQIGDGGTDWETPEQIEAANASDCGIAYLPNGVLTLCYDLSGAAKFRTNKAFGSSGFWSAAGTPSPAVSRQSAVGRGQGQAFRFRALGAAGASGSVEFSQCRDNRGVAWTSPVTAVAGARGPFCGGVWLGNGYGLLYTEHSTGKVRWLLATDPTSWPAGPGADTGMSGQVVGLTLTAPGVLIGLLWDWDGAAGNKRFRACRSRDRGATWEKDSSDIGALPALDTPPAVVSLEQMAYAVYVVNNTPQFAASKDSGVSWI